MVPFLSSLVSRKQRNRRRKEEKLSSDVTSRHKQEVEETAIVLSTSCILLLLLFLLSLHPSFPPPFAILFSLPPFFPFSLFFPPSPLPFSLSSLDENLWKSFKTGRSNWKASNPQQLAKQIMLNPNGC